MIKMRVTPLGVRVPQEMRDRIKEEATANRRSMNSEILVCLEEALKLRQIARQEHHAL